MESTPPEYEQLPNGVIHQVSYSKIPYNYEYSNKYNNYGERTNYMAYLRLGTLIGALKEIPQRILDVGYGNGAFMAAASTLIPYVAGCDLSPYPVPSGCHRVESLTADVYDVVTFFDSLEHFDDITIIKNLKCKYVFISVPWCPTTDAASPTFLNWYHRRPDEHLWHFNKESLLAFFDEYGYKPVLEGLPVEDAIRKNAAVGNRPNILTALFIKV
jgi:hypothetical protein